MWKCDDDRMDIYSQNIIQSKITFKTARSQPSDVVEVGEQTPSTKEINVQRWKVADNFAKLKDESSSTLNQTHINILSFNILNQTQPNEIIKCSLVLLKYQRGVIKLFPLEKSKVFKNLNNVGTFSKQP